MHGIEVAGEIPEDLVTVSCVRPVPTFTASVQAGRMKLSRAGAAAEAAGVAACAALATPTVPTASSVAKVAAPSTAARPRKRARPVISSMQVSLLCSDCGFER